MVSTSHSRTLIEGITASRKPVGDPSTMISAPAPIAVAVGDKVTIRITGAANAGAAADIGITTLWRPL